MKKAIAIFSILTGIAVIAMWTVLLVKGTPEEGIIALGFHLYSEFAMAVVLLVSGVMLFGNKRFSVETNMGGLGMLVYSTLNAAGYYGQKGEQPMMIMFIILFALAVLAICGHYYIKKSKL
jgi:hypothetical protein